MTSLEIADANVIGTNRDGIVTYWSRGAAAAYGIATGEAVGVPYTDLADWHLDPEAARTFQTLAVGDIWVRPLHVTTRDGRKLTMRAVTSVALNREGEREFLAYSTPDTAPDNLVMAGLPIHPYTGRDEQISFCDASHRVSCVGPFIGQLRGYLARDVIGADCLSFIHPEDHGAWLEAWKWALESSSRTESVLVRVRFGQGEWRWTEHSMTNKLDDPAIAAVVVQSRDATDTQQTSAALAAAEAALTEALASNNDGVMVVDGIGDIVFANEEMATLLGTSHEQLLRGPVDHLLAEVVPSALPHTGVAALPEPEQYEVPFTKPDGELELLQVSVRPGWDRQGQLAALIVMCTAADFD